MSKFYEKVHKGFARFLRRFYRIEIRGGENEPQTPGFLICANHISLHDPILIGAALNQPICFLAKKELFSIPLLSQLLRALGAVPLDRGSRSDVGALKKAISLLKEGQTVAIFPQGTRKPGIDPRKTETKNGAGFLVSRTGCSVLPVSIQAKGYRIRPFRKTYLTVGKPIPPPKQECEIVPNELYAAVSREVFRTILEQMREDGTL